MTGKTSFIRQSVYSDVHARFRPGGVLEPDSLRTKVKEEESPSTRLILAIGRRLKMQKTANQPRQTNGPATQLWPTSRSWLGGSTSPVGPNRYSSGSHRRHYLGERDGGSARMALVRQPFAATVNMASGLSKQFPAQCPSNYVPVGFGSCRDSLFVRVRSSHRSPRRDC